MATWQTITTRTVSGTGSINLPTGEDNQYRAFRLYLQLIRPPQNRYRNTKYPEPQEFIAKALFYKDLYVCGEREMKFPAEKWEFVADFSSQNLIAIKCLYDALVAVGMGVSVMLENQIKNYTYLELPYDKIAFKCYSNAAIRLRLEGLKHDTCDPINDKQQPPNNPPPPDRNPPPNDEPVDVSSPPNGDDDAGLFDPFPGDEEGNGTQQCIEYDVTLRLNPLEPELFPPVEGTFRVFGEIDGVGVKDGGRTAFIRCRGGFAAIDAPMPGCLEELFDCGVLTNTNPAYSDVELLNIVEVPM